MIMDDKALAAQKDFLLNGAPVATLSGEEFSRVAGVTLTAQVAAYYRSIGGKALSPAYGEVVLDEKGVDDDFAHGVGRAKAAAFAAVPQIVERGMVILPFGRHKEDEPILSAMVAAPLAIAGKEYVGVVVIRQNKMGDNRLYVHEVTIKEKLLEKVIQGVEKKPLVGSSNPTSTLATKQGAITKVLQNIVSAKSISEFNEKIEAAPATRGYPIVKKRGRGM
jgi:hypothetical protein